MGHTLEEYKGCDIIDIHPGACLWSRKLHDFLQPRRHLLMEPEDKYKPFIEPLLRKRRSTYRHTSLSGAHPRSYFESYDLIFNDDLLPKRDLLSPGDARLRQTNKTLLVTGTLSRRYRSIRGMVRNVHNANLVLNHMVQASQTNALFHGYGLVRMLFWHPDDTRSTVMPDMNVARGAYGAAIDVAADLVEIAGADRATLAELPSQPRALTRHRYPEIDQISADRVLKRMEDRGVKMPLHRRPRLHQAAIDRSADPSIDVDDEARRVIPLHLPVHKSLDAVMEAHEEKMKAFSETVSRVKGTTAFDMPYDYVFTIEAKKVLSENDLSKLGPYMDIWAVQVALEAAISDLKTRKPREAATTELERRVTKVGDDLRAISTTKRLRAHNLQTNAHTVQKEIHACHAETLAHDRRPFEALTTSVDEFWPQFGHFLLDVQPRAENLADSLTSPGEANTVMRDLVVRLWQLSASSVPMAVDRIGANAAQDLVPACPDMADAAKGGRLDVQDMTVRLLSRSMIEQLTKAYLDWPFRSTDVLPDDVLEEMADGKMRDLE